MIGGLLGAVHLRLPFLVAAALAGANALYGLVLVLAGAVAAASVVVLSRAPHPSPLLSTVDGRSAE